MNRKDIKNTGKKEGCLFLLLLVFMCLSCQQQPTIGNRLSADEFLSVEDSALAHADTCSDSIVVKYARGLRVDYRSDGIHVFISNPADTSRHSQEEEIVIDQPASRFICTTALQLGNFEVLGLEDRIVGMNTLRNLFSPAMHRQLEDGTTVKIGREGNFDQEKVIATQPDYIFVSASKHGGFEILRNCGIPIISHHGYKETNPLGQAEWIKLVGLLTGETHRANAVFSEIEKKYLTLQEEVARTCDGQALPTVMSGRQIRDGWYVVGGRSYMARLFHDAGARYVMDDNTQTGGVTLDFEAAYVRGVHADFWQMDGSHNGDFTLQTLRGEDERYATMDAFKSQQVIFCNFAQTPYRELAGVQPHYLLADFVKAFHPDILPNYSPHYYHLILP